MLATLRHGKETGLLFILELIWDFSFWIAARCTGEETLYWHLTHYSELSSKLLMLVQGLTSYARGTVVPSSKIRNTCLYYLIIWNTVLTFQSSYDSLFSYHNSEIKAWLLNIRVIDDKSSRRITINV